MTLEIIERVLEVDDFQIIRAVGATERIVDARALRYGVPYEVSDNGGRSFYHEVWRAGVFARSISHHQQGRARIPLQWHHQHQEKPYGAIVGTTDSKTDFVFRALVVNGERGDEMLELIEMGAVLGVSVGARPVNNRSFNGGVERIEAALKEVSLTASAQISDGEILAVRAVVEQDGEVEQDDEVIEEVDTPALDEAAAYLKSLERP